MAIQWGQLSPIAPPSVVANLPQQQNNQADTLAGGIMSGLAQGQQMQMNAQQMQCNDMTIQRQQQQMQDEQQLRQSGSGDKYLEVLKSQGKFDEAQKYQVYQEEYQGHLLRNKSSVLDLNAKERDKADRDNSINVAVMDKVSQVQDPVMQQQQYKQIRQDMTKKYPDLVMPEEFSAQTFGSVMRTNEIMQQTQSVQLESKVATLQQLQSMRDTLRNKKSQLEAQGKPTESITEKLGDVQDQINTHKSNKQTTVSQDDTINKELLQLDLGSVKESQAQSVDSGSNIERMENFKKLNAKYPTGMFAETGLNLAKAYSALTGRKLEGTQFGEAIAAGGMDFVMQRIQGTKGAISEREMEAFAKSSPGMTNTAEGNAMIIDVAIAVEKRKQELPKKQREYLRKNKSLEGFDEEWNKYINDNPVIDMKKLDKFGSAKTPNNKSAVTQELDGVTYEYENGKWFQKQ